ncbi:MAG: response regulator [Sulfitobacter sp.]|nr:response regulator [Sulfitobacter sp.]
MPQTQSMLSADMTAPPDATQVLILDDERFDRHRLARLCSSLEFSCEITNAVTLREFAAALERKHFELILVDYRLPDGTGLDALDMVRLSPRNNNAATIMITGQGQDSVAQSALASGCRDYLSKDDLSAPAFHRAVTNALQKADLSIQVERETFARAEVEAVLVHFASKCAQDIKPMVSRMMRQIRDLRAGEACGTIPATARFDGIEDSCITLWEFLVELERYQGAGMIPAPAADHVTPAPDTLPKRAVRKPPSPFARLRN